MRFQLVLFFVAAVSAIPLQLNPAASPESAQIQVRQNPPKALELPTVTDEDVQKAIEQMANKAPEGKREAAKARLSSPEGQNFVRAMLRYFAGGTRA
ncbi:hypothetical protein AA313_de0200083 [Arthrobotrys entomopaga]|nr:hypothetical protein AA313_de0200083 [Arthrobotrys entomopaga]